MRSLFAALCLLTASCVTTSAFVCPEPYAGYPTGPVTVSYQPTERVNAVCLSPGVKGCMYRFKGEILCHILIRNDIGPYWQKEVLDHEKCHCRGWPANHPR